MYIYLINHNEYDSNNSKLVKICTGTTKNKSEKNMHKKKQWTGDLARTFWTGDSRVTERGEICCIRVFL